jgi:hypothetical protein
MFRYETTRQKLLPRRKFFLRLLANLLLVLGLIIASLFIGMLGYHGYEGLSWLDAFLNAAMILGGMGPVTELHTAGGKTFAGVYALYSGLLLIAASGLLFAPLLHRVMHGLHAANEEDEDRDEKKSRK